MSAATAAYIYAARNRIENLNNVIIRMQDRIDELKTDYGTRGRTGPDANASGYMARIREMIAERDRLETGIKEQLEWVRNFG